MSHPTIWRGVEPWPTCKACGCLRPPEKLTTAGACLDSTWCATQAQGAK